MVRSYGLIWVLGRLYTLLLWSPIVPRRSLLLFVYRQPVLSARRSGVILRYCIAAIIRLVFWSRHCANCEFLIQYLVARAFLIGQKYAIFWRICDCWLMNKMMLLLYARLPRHDEELGNVV